MKNRTPREIAVSSAIIISLTITFILAILALFNVLKFNSILAYILTIIFSFTTSYIVIIFALERFIYRKIKLIYKRISDSKGDVAKNSLFGDRMDLRQDIIGDMNKQVSIWKTDKEQQLQVLQKSAQFRKEFIGNVSHELRTPIFTLQGYVETLIDGAMDDPQVNLKYLRKASKNADRLIKILNDLESITKLENERFELKIEKFEINALAKSVLEDLTNEAKRYSITLDFKDDMNKEFEVVADQEQIRQVIVNLVVNSIKYGKENGTTKIGFYDMHDKILVEVADDGIGIADEDMPRLFERFYRVEKSRSRDRGGTGLGLSIVKHIIEAHNQELNVRSSYSKGTTFGFTLKKAK